MMHAASASTPCNSPCHPGRCSRHLRAWRHGGAALLSAHAERARGPGRLQNHRAGDAAAAGRLHQPRGAMLRMCPTSLHMTQKHSCSPEYLVCQSRSAFCIRCVRALLRSVHTDRAVTSTEREFRGDICAGPVLRKESGGDPCTAGRRRTGCGSHGLGHRHLPKGDSDTGAASGACCWSADVTGVHSSCVTAASGG
jgi:hypothetical protein